MSNFTLPSYGCALDVLKKANDKWLHDGTIFLTRCGSHAYGTNISTSDEDFKGIAIPPREYVLGFTKKFEQAIFKEPDMVVFDLRKFMDLAAACNPNVIETLFTDPSDWCMWDSSWNKLLDNREKFISKRAKHTFSGYAISQLKKLRSHYRWLKNPPVAPPSRADFNLPSSTSLISNGEREEIESTIKLMVDSWQLDLDGLDDATKIKIQNNIDTYIKQMGVASKYEAGIDPLWMAAYRNLGLSVELQATLMQEKRYNTAMKEWKQYLGWKETRNKARAALEEKYGYDCKHAMHLVRLMRMCREIITEGKVMVKRPDAAELLEIRNGAWPYERLIEWAEQQDKDMNMLYLKSTLPHHPNMDELNKLCIEMIEDHLRK